LAGGPAGQDRGSQQEEIDMGLVRNLVALGVAKKLYDIARKPENQRKIKEMASSFANKANAQGARGPR
jgi:hypothetical protein